MKSRVIGIDLGSVSAKFALVQDGSIVQEGYARHRGDPSGAVLALLSEVPDWKSVPAVLTGSASVRIARALGVEPVNEVVALVAGVTHFVPDAGSVVEMGGQDSKLLQFRHDSRGKPVFDDFAMNTICAAGTGSFLDQQASRLGLTPEEMGAAALGCRKPPRIAGRCSVFAKSDMIHLQQIGATVEEIAAGLCFAVARNFRSTIAAGREFRGPVAFVGGVASNPAMIRAFEEAVEGKRLFIPRFYRVLVAAGAALTPKETVYLNEKVLDGPEPPGAVDPDRNLPPLAPHGLPAPAEQCGGGSERGVYLGIDVGSISTNLAAVNPDGDVVARVYIRTAGRPLEAVGKGLRLIRDRFQDEPRVLGAATTGSGRYMIGDFVGADTVRNEITAQARAALHIDPEVDTIFEIGGQDSKFISLRNGRVVDFEMNKVCAAGTGSFLEEQAEKLGVPITGFGPRALESRAPARLGERCTVFMETDVVSHQSEGAPLDQILAGLCISVVKNYLHRVVGRRAIGKRIFFQGGTAFNQGVVAAFNMILKDGKVTVPPNHDVTGAIGAALLAADMAPESTSFRGFGLAGETWRQDSFICRACANSCEIHRVTLEDRELYYGGRCEKYETGSLQIRQGGENLFPLRERLLREHAEESELEPNGPVVGIPEALWFWELYPFFGTFFRELGCRVVTSGSSDGEMVHRGVESTAAETCFPVKIAHGHVTRLIGKGVDYLFLPSILRSAPPEGEFAESYNCPFVEGAPYILDAGLSLKELATPETLRPVLDFSLPGGLWMKPLEETAEKLGFSPDAARTAAEKAAASQDRFRKALLEHGRKALASRGDRRALVIVSRPYNGNDPMVNTDLPQKLARLGALVIPMDFLELPLERVWKKHGDMYWAYGQRILAAAEAVKDSPGLHAVYISNFGCGPDSFIEHIFHEIMGDKPYLGIEIDEHAADAGIITRCEAFLDSLESERPGSCGKPGETAPASTSLEGRTLWIPYLSDASHVAAAVAVSAGLDARVVPPTTGRTVALGRSVTSGRECYPAIITSGSMMEILDENPPEKTAFFMGTASGPCRFGQYCQYHRMILGRMGFEDVPILTSSSSDSYGSVEGLSTFNRQKILFQGVSLVDNLYRARYRFRPYEANPGETDRVYREMLGRVCDRVRVGGNLGRVASQAAAAFEAIPGRSIPRKPRVAVFGEIYIRNDPYANDNTHDRIEQLGAEVVYSPVTEWLDFVNLSYIEKSKRLGRTGNVIAGKMKAGVMSMMKRPVNRPFQKLLSDTPHADAEAVLKAAEPYMPENIGGEAILCIGAPLALMDHGGIQGAVNVFPFGCLPGTVVAAVSRRLRRDRPDLPWLNLAFDGQEDTDNTSRLEAFIFQVRKYAEKNGG